MKEHNTGIFIAYRILFGLAILILFHSGRLHEHRVEDKNPIAPTAPVSLAPLPAASPLPRSLPRPANRPSLLTARASVDTRR